MDAHVAQPGLDGRPAPMLSIVIPAHNEAEAIGQALTSIRDYALAKQWPIEVVVVDDGSHDGTSDQAMRTDAGPLTVRVIRNERNRGKAVSVRRGMLEATGDLRLFCDADMSTPIEQLDRLLPWIDRGFEVVIGSRRVAGSELRPPQRMTRRTLGRIFRRFRSFILLHDIRDTQCGFKLFTREATEAAFSLQQVVGPAFDCEILALARARGFRIKEVGVLWQNNPDSRMHPMRDGLGMLLSLLQIRRRVVRMGRQPISAPPQPRQMERSI